MLFYRATLPLSRRILTFDREPTAVIRPSPR
jgi:hypothetical protein